MLGASHLSYNRSSFVGQLGCFQLPVIISIPVHKYLYTNPMISCGKNPRSGVGTIVLVCVCVCPLHTCVCGLKGLEQVPGLRWFFSYLA